MDFAKPLSMPSPGESFGRYVVEREVGRGAAGTVYRAHDAAGRVVALKLLNECDDDPDRERTDLTRRPLISQFSFTIDVREWGFADPRADMVRDARQLPEIRAIAAAGFPKLTVDDVVQARALGIDPTYIRRMRSAGVKGDLDNLAELRAVGVTPEFVARAKQAGVNPNDTDRLTSMQVLGVDPARPRPNRHDIDTGE